MPFLLAGVVKTAHALALQATFRGVEVVEESA
jgi:hypothetical protein